MPQTYISDTIAINDGDETSYDASQENGEIEILSAECRWRGIETTEQETSYNYATNTNSDTATATKSTSYDSNSKTVIKTDSTGNVAIPSPPSGYSFTENWWDIRVYNGGDAEVTVDVGHSSPIETTIETVTIPADGSRVLQSQPATSIYYVGETIGAYLVDDDDKNNSALAVEVETTTAGEKTVTNNKTATASYPSVPSGYSFDNHRQQEWRGGTEEVDEYHYSTRVGQSESITSTDPNTTVEVQLETQGQDSNTYTVTHSTENPSVSGDVTADYSGTVPDGEWSEWVPLSGFEVGINQFQHQIGGSGEAKFEFRYTWQSIYPDPVGGKLEIHIAGTIYQVALANLTSSRLHYTGTEAQHNGSAYTIDCIEANSYNAVPGVEFYHPVHGYLSPRYYNSESI